MDEDIKGMYFGVDRKKTVYRDIIEFVDHNELDPLFEEMYGRCIKDYIEIFGLQYHNGAIASEIIMGLCEGGMPEPRMTKVRPDYSIEIFW